MMIMFSFFFFVPLMCLRHFPCPLYLAGNEYEQPGDQNVTASGTTTSQYYMTTLVASDSRLNVSATRARHRATDGETSQGGEDSGFHSGPNLPEIPANESISNDQFMPSSFRPRSNAFSYHFRDAHTPSSRAERIKRRERRKGRRSTRPVK